GAGLPGRGGEAVRRETEPVERHAAAAQAETAPSRYGSAAHGCRVVSGRTAATRCGIEPQAQNQSSAGR
ncbi:MAG: hypothetical protein AN487_24150, partial [Anabaena sp. CRKS33]